MTHIKLGQTARELTTGITGIVVVIGEELNGNRRITIQQKVREDGGLTEAYDHDEAAVEFVDDGIVGKVINPPACDIGLGVKVRDLATGMEGVTTQRLTYLNGCIRFLVTGPVTRDGTNAIAQLDYGRLKVIKPIKELQEKARVQPPTGGPLTRLMRMRRA